MQKWQGKIINEIKEPKSFSSKEIRLKWFTNNTINCSDDLNIDFVEMAADLRECLFYIEDLEFKFNATEKSLNTLMKRHDLQSLLNI